MYYAIKRFVIKPLMCSFVYAEIKLIKTRLSKIYPHSATKFLPFVEANKELAASQVVEIGWRKFRKFKSFKGYKLRILFCVVFLGA